MTKIMLRKAGAKKKATRKPKLTKTMLNLSLPTEDNIPPEHLSAYTILIYGAIKIGKTSLAARFPHVFIMSLEPGTKALRTRKRKVPDWEHFVGYVDLLVAGKTEYETVVIDTVDKAYTWALNSVCQKDLIEHPSENNDFGKTWDRIKVILDEQITRLTDHGLGVIFLSHDTEKEIELRDGRTIDQIRPTMAKGAKAVVETLVDVVGNYGYDGGERVLYIDGSQERDGGCRCEENFIRKGGNPATAGDRITSISMGRSSHEAYANLVAAFKNEQVSTTHLQEKPCAVKKKRKVTLKKKSTK